jgi:hypothetical protein
MDYAKLHHPSGAKIQAVYAGNSGRWLCKLSEDKWAIVYQDGEWADNYGDSVYSRQHLVDKGWGEYMNSEPVWSAGAKPKTQAIQCVCEMRTLMIAGCPSARGKACRSI